MLLFPIGTDRRRRGPPWITWALIAANCYVYFFLQGTPASSNFELVFARFRWWMPITYMFAHGDLMHLVGNMLFLWVFGPHAEDALGRGRFVLLYFSAGLGSAALHVVSSYAFYPDELAMGLLGASGAIMGVVSLFVLRFHGVLVRFFVWFILPYVFQVRALWVGIAFFLFDFGLALINIGTEGAGGVAHWAHIGGFIVGGIWAWAMRLPEEGTHEIKRDEVRDLIAAGAWRSAAALLEERIAARPDDAELHRDAAACYEMLRGMSDRAARHWNQHLRLLLLHGQQEEALDRFRKLTHSFRPDDFDPAVLMRLGAAAESQDNHELALAAWLACASAHPTAPQAPQAALRAANLLERRGSEERAARVLAMIEERWPESEAALAASRHRRNSRRLGSDRRAT